MSSVHYFLIVGQGRLFCDILFLKEMQMRIDPTTITAAPGISPDHKIAGDNQKSVRQLFEHILDDTVNSLKNNEVLQKETIAWMKHRSLLGPV